MHTRRFYFILLATLCPLLLACIWDRDTLAEEAKGKASEVRTLVGWVDRYPDKYYEMRLERVRNELKKQPDKLALYDDAAVALDRLHRSDEAIATILEKKKRIALLADSPQKVEHEYRYLANLGTFYAHRWMGKARAEREANYEDLIKAEELIAAAIKLNPDAHFGREKYQLMTLRWLNPENDTVSKKKGDRGLPIVGQFEDIDADEAVEGLLGMVRLGAASRSVDIHVALAKVLSHQGHASLALIAQLRCNELTEAGGESLHHNFEVRAGLLTKFLKTLEDEEPVQEWYKKAREVTESRSALREVYILEKLEKGEHPDTHPEFWASWREFELPALPDEKTSPDQQRMLMTTGILAVCGLLGLSILVVWWLKRAGKKNAQRIPFNLG